MATRRFWVGIALSLLGAVSGLACSDGEGDGAQGSQPADVVAGSPVPGMSDPAQPTTGTPPAVTPPSQVTSPPGSAPETPAAGAGAEPPPSTQPSEPADPMQEDPPGPGTMVAMPPATPSSGCGASDWPESGEYTIDVDGTMREYIVKIPDAYDPETPYKLVFAWHGLGGTAQQIASGFRGGYYGLETRAAGSTIFVAGQGLATSQGGAGWPNTGGRDIAFVRSMLDWLRGSYCVDEERIFSTGMSYGGIMSNTVGCQLGDVVRAIAPIAGSGPRSFFGSGECVGQVAAWLAHGNQDTVVSFESGVGSRDHWLMTNHCGSEGTPVEPSPCLQYAGCDAGYPVHFCEFEGGHTVPSFASAAIWDFFSQF